MSLDNPTRVAKAIAMAGFFGVAAIAVVVLGFVMFTDSENAGAATAAPAIGALKLPVAANPAGAISRLSPRALSTISGKPVAPRLTTSQPDLLDALLEANQPRLVQSFPALPAGYVASYVILSTTATPSDSVAHPTPVLLFGAAAGWMYAALTGAFGDDGTSINGGGPSQPPDQANPPTANPPTSNPPGNNPPANNPPGNNPPGNNPPANNPPGNNPPGSNPPGNNPPTGNPPAGGPPGGNPTRNPSGNPPGGPPGGGPIPGDPESTPTGEYPPPMPPTPVVPAQQLPASAAPEPVSMVMIGSGLAALAALRRRPRRD